MADLGSLLKDAEYPIKCYKCYSTIQAPRESFFDARPVLRKIKKKWRVVCTECTPIIGLSNEWVKKFGHTNVDGAPVDKNRKPCSIDSAFGFRKYHFKDDERRCYYVKKKA
jgi:hypothetical protein